jgi:hypothetical protein
MSVAGSEESRSQHHSRSVARSRERERDELNALVNQTVKLAFKEREASTEAQTQRLEERRLRERVVDLADKVSAVTTLQHEMKSDQTLVKRIASLEHKLARSNALVVDLQKSNEDMEERFTAHVIKIETELTSEENCARAYLVLLCTKIAPTPTPVPRPPQSRSWSGLS